MAVSEIGDDKAPGQQPGDPKVPPSQPLPHPMGHPASTAMLDMMREKYGTNVQAEHGGNAKD